MAAVESGDFDFMLFHSHGGDILVILWYDIAQMFFFSLYFMCRLREFPI